MTHSHTALLYLIQLSAAALGCVPNIQEFHSRDPSSGV